MGRCSAAWPAWLEAQQRLAAQLHAEHIPETGSSHAIAIWQPQLVIDAIKHVVTATAWPPGRLFGGPKRGAGRNALLAPAHAAYHNRGDFVRMG